MDRQKQTVEDLHKYYEIIKSQDSACRRPSTAAIFSSNSPLIQTYKFEKPNEISMQNNSTLPPPLTCLLQMQNNLNKLIEKCKQSSTPNPFLNNEKFYFSTKKI